MRWETKNKGGAVMAEEARVFFLRKRRERAEDTERRVKELDGEAQAQPG